jgi:hypothetical protein
MPIRDEIDYSTTEEVTSTNVAVVGEATAIAVGELYQTLGDAVAKAAINNVFVQQQANMTNQAASTAAVTNLLNLPI